MAARRMPCILLTTAIIATIGCRGPATPQQSPMFQGIDFGILIEKPWTDKGVKWGAHGYGSGSGGGLRTMQHHKGFEGDLECEAVTLDKLLETLRMELQKSIESHGGTVTRSPVEGPDAATKGFQLDYQVGTLDGGIRAVARRRESKEHDPYPLYLKSDVDEPQSDLSSIPSEPR